MPAVEISHSGHNVTGWGVRRGRPVFSLRPLTGRKNNDLRFLDFFGLSVNGFDASARLLARADPLRLEVGPQSLRDDDAPVGLLVVL